MAIMDPEMSGGVALTNRLDIERQWIFIQLNRLAKARSFGEASTLLANIKMCAARIFQQEDKFLDDRANPFRGHCRQEHAAILKKFGILERTLAVTQYMSDNIIDNIIATIVDISEFCEELLSAHFDHRHRLIFTGGHRSHND